MNPHDSTQLFLSNHLYVIEVVDPCWDDSLTIIKMSRHVGEVNIFVPESIRIISKPMKTYCKTKSMFNYSFTYPLVN